MFKQQKNPVLSKFYDVIYFFFRYPTPSNLNFLWNYGVLAFVFFIAQILTGLFLSMHFVPNVDLAFLSVENIMRNISYGWLIRYMHANGASFFFLFVYLHFFRNVYYMSYLPPRKYIWLTGVIIMLLMIITAFTGYVLPWGQMSFWAATVITNLFSAVPIIGGDIVKILWGNYSVSNATLNRFYTLHFLLPFVLLAFIILHFLFLHEKGSSNPLMISNKFDKQHFHPYFTVKDAYVTVIAVFIFLIFVGFYPNTLGHPDNYIQADPLVTPPHIVPEWYFLFFYAILRSIPSKLGGIAVLGLSLIVLFVLPFCFKQFRKLKISINPMRYTLLLNKDWHNMFVGILYQYFAVFVYHWSNNKEYLYKVFFYMFIFNCVALSILGAYPAEGIYLNFSRFFTVLYFLYFIIIIVKLNGFTTFKMTDHWFFKYFKTIYLLKRNIFKNLIYSFLNKHELVYLFFNKFLNIIGKTKQKRRAERKLKYKKFDKKQDRTYKTFNSVYNMRFDTELWEKFYINKFNKNFFFTQEYWDEYFEYLTKESLFVETKDITIDMINKLAWRVLFFDILKELP